MSAADPLTPAEVISQHERRLRRRRRAWWILIGAGVLIVLGMAMTPLAVQYSWHLRGQRLLQVELDKIAGEPLTTAELAAAYALPATAENRAKDWQRVLQPFETPAYEAAAQGVSFLHGDGPPAFDAPVSPQDQQATEAFLTLQKSNLEALKAVAVEGGVTRFPRDYTLGLTLPLPESSQLMNASKALRLEFFQLTRARDFDAALANLAIRMRMADTLRDELSYVMLLTRLVIVRSVLRDIQQMTDAYLLPDAQLHQLQKLTEAQGFRTQLVHTTIGERAMAYQMFNYPNLDEHMLSTDLGRLETHRDAARISRPGDCAKLLELFRESVYVSQLPISNFADKAEEIESLSQAVKTANSTDPWPLKGRYSISVLLTPTFPMMADSVLHTEVLNELVAIRLAAQRYAIVHVRLPINLEVLRAQNLISNVTDPYTRQPYRFLRTNDQSAMVYSLGKDRIDQAGEVDPTTYGPDIALRISLPTPTIESRRAGRRNL